MTCPQIRRQHIWVGMGRQFMWSLSTDGHWYYLALGHSIFHSLDDSFTLLSLWKHPTPLLSALSSANKFMYCLRNRNSRELPVVPSTSINSNLCLYLVCPLSFLLLPYKNVSPLLKAYTPTWALHLIFSSLPKYLAPEISILYVIRHVSSSLRYSIILCISI